MQALMEAKIDSVMTLPDDFLVHTSFVDMLVSFYFG